MFDKLRDTLRRWTEGRMPTCPPGRDETHSEFGNGKSEMARGKSISDLADPAWQLVSGLPPWSYAGAIWRPYSALDSEKAFRSHSLIYSCCRTIASAFCEPPYEAAVTLRTEHGAERKVLASHPLLEVLNRPNEFYSRDDARKYVILRLILTGRAYLWKWRKRSGDIAELWPIPSSWVREIPGTGNRLIDSYAVSQLGGGFQVVKFEDMVRLSLVDPSTMMDCVSPLQAAQHDYQLDMERENYLVEMLTNLHVFGIKVKTQRQLARSEKDELRAAFSDRGGVGKRGNVAIVDPGFDFELMEPLKDMDWPGLTSLAEARICAAFGVPAIIAGARIGIENGSQYSNYSTARRSFYVETMQPLWTAVGSAFTHQIASVENEPQLSLGFDTSQLAELQEDLETRSQRARDNFKAGLVTRNEARAIVGLRAVPGGDVYCQTPPVGARVEEGPTA